MKLAPNCQACGQPIENDTARQAYARFEQQKATFEAKALADAEAKVAATQKAALANARHEGRQAAETAADARIAAAEAQVATLKENADKDLKAAKALGAAEAEAELAEIKQARIDEREKLANENRLLQRRLEELTAAERKKLAHNYLRTVLRAAFPDDKIREVKDGAAGADFVQTVMHQGKECGEILWELKDVAKWDKKHVDKLVKDQKREGSDHGVLVVTAMPADALPVHMVDNVHVVKPENVISIAVPLRRDLIRRAGEPDVELNSDHAELFKYEITAGQKHRDEFLAIAAKSRTATEAMVQAHKRIEKARKELDAAAEAEYLTYQAELDEFTGRNKRDGDED